MISKDTKRTNELWTSEAGMLWLQMMNEGDLQSEDEYGHLNYVQDSDPEYRRLKENFEK